MDLIEALARQTDYSVFTIALVGAVVSTLLIAVYINRVKHLREKIEHENELAHAKLASDAMHARTERERHPAKRKKR